jgi:hypothetical protein
MDGGLATLLLVGSARGFAVDGDDFGRGAGQRHNPGDKAALERLGVKRGEDISEVIVRGRSRAERPEPPQKSELFLAKSDDIDKRLRPGQHGKRTQQQHLTQRINHFAALAGSGRSRKCSRKTTLSASAPQSAATNSIAVLQTRIRGLRQIQHFTPLSSSSSPDCPGGRTGFA